MQCQSWKYTNLRHSCVVCCSRFWNLRCVTFVQFPTANTESSFHCNKNCLITPGCWALSEYTSAVKTHKQTGIPKFKSVSSQGMKYLKLNIKKPILTVLLKNNSGSIITWNSYDQRPALTESDSIMTGNICLISLRWAHIANWTWHISKTVCSSSLLVMYKEMTIYTTFSECFWGCNNSEHDTTWSQ